MPLFYLIFLVVIVLCLGGIVYIVARKAPHLTLIDTESIPKERNLAKKREIMDERMMRTVKRWSAGAGGAVGPLAARVQDWFRRLVKALMTLDRQFRYEKFLKPEQKAARADKLRAEASKLSEAGKTGEAEKKLFEILAFDETNESVYRDLGELYTAAKRWDRARDTFAFLVQLLVKRRCGQTTADSKGVPMARFEAFAENCPASAADHAEIARQYVNFALACQNAGEIAVAKSGLENALSFEPTNPKHLDLLVEACIMDGDKDRARTTWERLCEANSENNKLPVLKERIEAMADEDAQAG